MGDQTRNTTSCGSCFSPTTRKDGKQVGKRSMGAALQRHSVGGPQGPRARPPREPDRGGTCEEPGAAQEAGGFPLPRPAAHRRLRALGHFRRPASSREEEGGVGAGHRGRRCAARQGLEGAGGRARTGPDAGLEGAGGTERGRAPGAGGWRGRAGARGEPGARGRDRTRGGRARAGARRRDRRRVCGPGSCVHECAQVLPVFGEIRCCL